MDRIILKSHAKINWMLDVLRKRPDGYHDIETIFQRIELHDDVVLNKIGKGIEMTCDQSDIPLDESNTSFKVTEMFLEKHRINQGVHIHINKRIPLSGGLGGGSSNAATTLLGLSELFNLDLSFKELSKLSLFKGAVYPNPIGADITFFLQDKPCFAEGLGEILTPLNQTPMLNIIIVNPKIEFPEGFKKTAWAYKKIDTIDVNHPDTKSLLNHFKEGDWDYLIDNMSNVFEQVMFDKFPIIKEVKQKLIGCGCKNALMCGAGPSVFGIMDNADKNKIYKKMKSYGEIISTKPFD